MKPRYNVSRQNRMRARRPDQSAPTKRDARATEQCPECGTWVGNVARAHARSEGGQCRGVRPVNLEALPPVVLPKPRTSSATTAHPKGSGNGVRAWGNCETCDAIVTGERRFCGLCLADRMAERNRR